ncbi:MAG: hypothetical protein ACFE9J_16190 [Candidatus Hermodarchaeota archaeon]
MNKVSIEKLAEHFFPAPLPYRYYFISKIRKNLGFDPLSWDIFEKIENKSDLEAKLTQTVQIAHDGIESIKVSLESLIKQKKIYGKIESNPDGSGSYFIKGKDENQIQKILQENLLDIKKFLKEFYPEIVFYIPPSINRKIDEIIAEAQRYNIELIVREAEDLKKEFFK